MINVVPVMKNHLRRVARKKRRFRLDDFKAKFPALLAAMTIRLPDSQGLNGEEPVAYQ